MLRLLRKAGPGLQDGQIGAVVLDVLCVDGAARIPGGRGAQPVRVLWGGVVAEATALVFAAVSNAGQRDDGTGASV